MLVKIRSVFPWSRVLKHAVSWLVYSCIVYVGNTFINAKVSYWQIILLLPLFMLIFYVGFFIAKKYKELFKIKIVCRFLLPFILLFFFFCDFWVYQFLPAIGFEIAYLKKRNWSSYAVNYGQYIVRFLAYGIGFYLLDLPARINRLETKLLQLEIVPHNLYNAWNTILNRVTAGSHKVVAMINGYADVQKYAVKIARAEQSTVPIELELAKLRSWIRTLDVEVQLTVNGECEAQQILPMASIELLQNALKYGDKSKTIQLVFDLLPGHLKLSVTNCIAEDAAFDGLGTGMDNLQKRMQYSKEVEGELYSLYSYSTGATYEVNLILKSLNKTNYEKN